MTLGFVSAILPDLSLEDVLAFAAEAGYDCVELMCWPKGKAARRYAGVTHLDATRFGKADARRVNEAAAAAGVTISGLCYYPNPLAPDPDEAKVYIDHIKKVIQAAALFGYSILTLAALGFVGLGAQIPTPEWGAMITDGLQYALTGQWWIGVFPGIGLLILVATTSILADKARDILDPRGKYAQL